ncbi:MAG: energy-coupling factor transporter transmembrane component T family protein [Anaerovoracaceae bacterium]
MIRDITLGQYFTGESVVHRLDPRTKILAALIYIVGIFLVKSFIGLAFVFLFLTMVIVLSKVPLSFILRGLKPVFLIIIFTFVLNLFMIPGKEIFTLWIFKITEESLNTAFFMAARLILLIIGSSLLTLTTKPISLTDGIEYLLAPFKKIGLPAHELAMMMTIALRFIPILLEETDKIMKAQQARGADFETGSIFKRAKNLVPILIPLFIGSFRIAQEMALAMEARCYRGGEGRTRMNKMQYKGADIFAGIIMLLFLIVTIVERIYII